MYAQPNDLLLQMVCCRVNAVVPSGILTEAIKAYAAGVGMTLDDIVNNQSTHMIIQRYTLTFVKLVGDSVSDGHDCQHQRIHDLALPHKVTSTSPEACVDMQVWSVMHAEPDVRSIKQLDN